jgi:hypothetical protein
MMFITHILKEGERLDSVAYTYWGDTNLTPVLMFDNPHLSPVQDIAPGEEIFVRDTVEDNTLITLQILPAWRQ